MLESIAFWHMNWMRKFILLDNSLMGSLLLIQWPHFHFSSLVNWCINYTRPNYAFSKFYFNWPGKISRLIFNQIQPNFNQFFLSRWGTHSKKFVWISLVFFELSCWQTNTHAHIHTYIPRCLWNVINKDDIYVLNMCVYNCKKHPNCWRQSCSNHGMQVPRNYAYICSSKVLLYSVNCERISSCME